MCKLNINHIVLDDAGKLVQEKLNRASEKILTDEYIPYLDEKCKEILDYDSSGEEKSSRENENLIASTLSSMERLDNGRLLVKLPWRSENKHLLGHNFQLSKQILLSNLRKFKDNDNLLMIDKAFKEQVTIGAIEKIPNLDKFLLEHPEAAFLAHMPIFKLDRDTTKCRNVYLSNVTGKDSNKAITLNNNQCMLAGPCLNNKICTNFMQLRFGKSLLCFDLVKAFLSIALQKSDSVKLCLLWFNNVSKKDFSIVAYKNVRLPFGLKCSPFLLMICLYKILVIDTDKDSPQLKELKQAIWSNIYMDNGAVVGDTVFIKYAFANLSSIFHPYQFDVQQIYTNCPEVQKEVDSFSGIKTPNIVKLFGMSWDRTSDLISMAKFQLDPKASTKREVLRTIANNFDLFNINGPLLNRARLFMHKLQCDEKLAWDAKLSFNLLKSWQNICKQVNSAPRITLSRYIGDTGDTFSLIAFVDSSSAMIGVTIYVYSATENKTKFLLARNKIISQNLSDKSMPTLELTAINFGVQTLVDVHTELSGEIAVCPINFQNCFLFSDSLVCLNWLNLYINSWIK